MQARGLRKGFEVATHQDLSGLFITRAVQQYLCVDGSFAFVVTNPVLDPPLLDRLHTGDGTDPDHPLKVDFTGSWDLRRLRPQFFPRASAVVFGRRGSLAIGQRGNNAVPLPRETEIWTGRRADHRVGALAAGQYRLGEEVGAAPGPPPRETLLLRQPRGEPAVAAEQFVRALPGARVGGSARAQRGRAAAGKYRRHPSSAVPQPAHPRPLRGIGQLIRGEVHGAVAGPPERRVAAPARDRRGLAQLIKLYISDSRC